MKQSWIVKFFIYTFLGSFGLWIIPVLFGLNSALAYVFYALGGIMPSTVAVFLVYQKKNKNYFEDFWHRIINVSQVKLKWYVFILLFMPIANILAMYINYFANGVKPDFATFINYVSNPLNLIFTILYMLIFGPFIEELGWRGFALDHLEKKYKWLVSSLIISIFWAFWHFPLFIIGGTYQYDLIQGSYRYFIDFMAGFLPASVIMGYLYYKNGRSILAPILFHFMINFSGELFNITNDIKPYRTLIMYIATIVILIYEKNSWYEKS